MKFSNDFPKNSEYSLRKCIDKHSVFYEFELTIDSVEVVYFRSPTAQGIAKKIRRYLDGQTGKSKSKIGI